jgi:hypothetical protein
LVGTDIRDGSWLLRPTFWLPSDGLYDKARADRIPYHRLRLTQVTLKDSKPLCSGTRCTLRLLDLGQQLILRDHL